MNGQANWDWSQVREACTSMSLFAEKRIVELRLASFRVGTKGAEALTALASAPLEDTIVIVSMPSDWTVKNSPGTKSSQRPHRLWNAPR